MREIIHNQVKEIEQSELDEFIKRDGRLRHAVSYGGCEKEGNLIEVQDGRANFIWVRYDYLNAIPRAQKDIYKVSLLQSFDFWFFDAIEERDCALVVKYDDKIYIVAPHETRQRKKVAEAERRAEEIARKHAAWKPYPQFIPEEGERGDLVLYTPDRNERFIMNVYFEFEDASHNDSCWKSPGQVFWMTRKEVEAILETIPRYQEKNEVHEN